MYYISGGGGGVVSVTNSDSSLTISPTTGAVIASINPGKVNSWTGTQSFLGMVFGTRVVTAAGTITMASNDNVIIVNKTVGAATILNLIASPTTGTIVFIKDGKADANTNNITITPAAGTIDGAATYVLNLARAAVLLVYNGTEWSVIGSYNGTVI